MSSGGYVAIVEIDLHFGEAHDLKAKRKEVKSLKDLINGRFGAAVAETDHQDKWQRAVLTAALVDSSHHRLAGRVDELERWMDARTPAGASTQRTILSVEDLG